MHMADNRGTLWTEIELVLDPRRAVSFHPSLPALFPADTRFDAGTAELSLWDELVPHMLKQVSTRGRMILLFLQSMASMGVIPPPKDVANALLLSPSATAAELKSLIATGHLEEMCAEPWSDEYMPGPSLCDLRPYVAEIAALCRLPADMRWDADREVLWRRLSGAELTVKLGGTAA